MAEKTHKGLRVRFAEQDFYIEPHLDQIQYEGKEFKQ